MNRGNHYCVWKILEKVWKETLKKNENLTPALVLCSFWVSCPPEFHHLAFSDVSLSLAPRRLSSSANRCKHVVYWSNCHFQHSEKTILFDIVYNLSVCRLHYLEAVILRACVFSLRVGRRSELQSSCVDVEAAMFCGERGRHQLVILKPGQKYN